jgi:PAS domain S-box-containing protein
LDSFSRVRIDGDSGLSILWEDGERVFCRAWRESDNGDRTAVVAVVPASEQPAPSCLDRLAHEYGLKDELDSAWAVRPLEMVRDRGRTMLVLEDFGGEPLDRRLGSPMEMGGFLRLAVNISMALGKLHRRAMVHKDLKPAHIVVDCADELVRLTGFGLASRLPRERQAPAPPETIAGTLAYMAPEQTGRMNRSVDTRSDLYALGVTLYQMLTGGLPFTAADPMEWVHCHIARRPVPPAERLNEIPGTVSAIIMKLLAKTAEDRYQTAVGLEADLRRCLAEWETQRRIDDFPLGAHDTPDRLLIPEKLYGRAGEIERLLAAFDRVVKSGRPELVLVSGYAGIGKSSVVNELHKVLVAPRGLFASGKFDQYKRDIPYATLAQAFQSLIRPLLGMSDAELTGWRDALEDALGPNGRLIVDLVPELKVIIGEQPTLPELPPQDAQRRFQLVIRRFIGVFAQSEHPLVLFLDDLQWLDAATLDLIEDLLTQSDLQHLMLIGAYRDNEVTAAHPLRRKLEAIKTAAGKVAEITVAPLARADLGQLIADALRCEPERAAPLAQLVQEKTGGNPFFAIQFISSLAEEGLLTFDHDAARWAWNLDHIHVKGYTDNVVELMVGKLSRLPAEAQKAVEGLSCLGNSAEMTTLALVYGTSVERGEADLWEAVRAGLVERQGDTYRFMHDRVQEAAYLLVPERLRAETHLRIGRLLATHTPAEKRDEAIFDIVNQFDRGVALITAGDEREQVAELNLIAGKRAKASTAYASALKYLTVGSALLPDGAWERRHELIYALELDRAECEFLTGEVVVAEQRLKVLSTRAASSVERATVACLCVDLYTTLGQNARAITVSLDCLRDFGIDWLPYPTKEEARREYDRIWLQLGSRPIEGLIDLPMMTDPASLATLDVLTKVFTAAMYKEANLACLVICRAVNLSLERGNCDGSTFAYVMLGAIAGARFGDYRAGFRFGQLGYELVEQRGLRRFQARVFNQFGAHVLPWAKHIRTGRGLLRQAFEVANKNGDLTFIAYSCHALTANLLAVGDPLPEVQREAEHGLAFAKKTRFRVVIDLMAIQLGLIRTLRGLTPKFGSFNEAQFDELRMERRLAENPDLAHTEFFYWTRKLQARFLAGDHTSAVNAASQAQSLLWIALPGAIAAEYHFYGALSRAAFCDSATTDQRQQHLQALAAHLQQLETWAENCPENFANRAALVEAELARIEGRELDAERLYEEAIRSARANGFVHNEALAHELAARFYAARGFEKIAHVYLRDARHGYLRWGADGKVRQLDQRYPHLREEERELVGRSTIGAPLEHLDLATVIKVSLAVSGEIVLEKLIDTLMRTAIEQAGAARGLLILSHGPEHRIAAEATTVGDAVLVEMRDEPLTPAALPESVFHYVVRTGESVILDDASGNNSFAGDQYFSQHHARSILCLPLMNEANLTGQLYLENNLAPRVFTPNRIAILKVLASQAAISLENARLHTELVNENRDRKQAQDELRASEERWRGLFESVPIGVALITPDGRYFAVNRAFQKMLAYSEAELLGRSPIELTHEDERAATEAFRAARTAGDARTARREKRYRRKNGSVIWVDISSFLLPVAQGSALEARFAIDITERKQAEENLRQSETFLIQAQQISQTGSWYWNVKTGEVRWSAEHFRLFAYDPATTQPSYALFVEPIHPDDRPSIEQTIATAVAEKSQFQFEYRIVLPDGEVKHLVSSGRPGIAEFDGLEYIGTVMDITERKRAEAEARESERRYRELHTEMAHAGRVATMGQLSASIAHEINQPIAGVITNANAGLRWLGARRPNLEEARQAFGRIMRDGNRAREVIDRVRALARKAPPRFDRLDINEAVREVVTLVQAEMRRNRIQLQTRFGDGLPHIAGDRVQLQQVTTNLIVNAIEAMSDVGEGLRELTIVSGAGSSNDVFVEVQDTGPGLDPANLDRLFQSFYTTKPDGMGMGLAICRSIVEAHGGRLSAAPNQPQGAVFRLTLPVEEPRLPNPN